MSGRKLFDGIQSVSLPSVSGNCTAADHRSKSARLRTQSRASRLNSALSQWHHRLGEV